MLNQLKIFCFFHLSYFNAQICCNLIYVLLFLSIIGRSNTLDRIKDRLQQRGCILHCILITYIRLTWWGSPDWVLTACSYNRDQCYLHSCFQDRDTLMPDHQFIHSEGAILSGKINPTWMCPRVSAYQSETTPPENNIFQNRSVGLFLSSILICDSCLVSSR